MSNKRLIFDIETLGTKPDAIVVQVAAVLWNDDTDDHVVLKQTWDLDTLTQHQAGRSVDYNTMLWWKNQSKDAFNTVFDDSISRLSADDFRLQFTEFMDVVNKYYGSNDIEVWANSPSFDLVILESLLGIAIYKYRNWRDQRTLEAVYKLVLRKDPKTHLAQVCDEYATQRSNGGFPHTATYDAIWHGKFISLMLKSLCFSNQGYLL